MPLIQKIHKMNDFHVSSFHVQNKKDLMYRMSQYGCQTYGSKGSYRSGIRDEQFGYVYHAEKVRPKFHYENVYYKSGHRKGELKESKKIYDREGGWNVRIFKFDMKNVKKLEQHSRYFTVIL